MVDIARLVVEGKIGRIRESNFQGKIKHALDFAIDDAKGGFDRVRVGLPDGFKVTDFIEGEDARIPVCIAITPAGAASWKLNEGVWEAMKREGARAGNGKVTGARPDMGAMGGKGTEARA